MKVLRNSIALGIALILAPSARAQRVAGPEFPEVITVPAGDHFLRWQGQPGRTYFVQASDQNSPLALWTWAPLIESGHGVEIRYETGSTAGKAFFRLHHTDLAQPLGVSLEDWDIDGDSVSNWDELTKTHTNPLDWDSDGDGKSDYFTDSDDDGMPDIWELRHFGNLTTADPDADGDIDGLTNAQESLLNSDPDATDTDSDGLPDAEDAAPANALIDWHKTPVPLFILDELPIEDIDQLILDDFSENGTVLFRKWNHEGPDTRIVVDRNLIAHEDMPLEPAALGDFGCDCPTLFDDKLFGIRLEVEAGSPDGVNRDRLRDPLPGVDPEYSAYPPYGDQFPGYHDAILDVRGTFRADKPADSPWDISTPFGKLPDTESDSKASIERYGNIVLPREYFRFDPAANASAGGYLPSLALPRLSTVRSATLVQSEENGPETRWHLVCSKWDLFHPFTARDLMLSKNGAAFQPAELDGAACRTLVGSGPGWVAARSALWCNGQWRSLEEITSKDPDVEKILLLDILDNGTGIARITLDGGTEKFALLRMPHIVELHPKLRNEADAEIEGSQYPDALPAANAMVERDPGVNLDDASTVRIAWRDMKVKIGKNFTDKHVTWSMVPLFTPWHVTAEHPEGEPEDDPRFRGKWGTAADAAYRNRFSASAQYGAHGFTAQNPVVEEGTSAQVHQRARTTVDADGYTAIRVNLPPIGFNKARVRIEIDGRPPLDLIDLEVPAVVVIDPGHGSGGAIDGSTDGGTGLFTLVREYDTAQDIAARTLTQIEGLKDEKPFLFRGLWTKGGDDPRQNIGLNDREMKAREFGADVFVSLHFDGATTDPNSKQSLYRNPFGMIDQDDTLWNRNPRADWALALRVRRSVQAAIAAVEPQESIAASATAYDNYDATHDPDAIRVTSEINESNLQKGLGALNDGGNPGQQNGNYRVGDLRYVPCRSTLIELERTSNEQADNLFNENTAYDNATGAITLTPVAESMRAEVARRIAEACIQDALIRDLADQAEIPLRDVGRLDYENE